MKLYHGTSERQLSSVLANGLRPRGNRATTWQEWPSMAEHVYLTNTYPFFFGINASDPDSDERAVVFEVDVDQLTVAKFYPDEDFVAQDMERRIGRDRLVKQHGSHRKALRKLHAQALKNLDSHRDRWEESLMGMGTCSYKGHIPPQAITRYCLLQWSGNNGSKMGYPLYHVSPTIFHHEYQVEYQQGLLDWMFDGEASVDEGITRLGIEVVDLRCPTLAAA